MYSTDQPGWVFFRAKVMKGSVGGVYHCTTQFYCLFAYVVQGIYREVGGVALSTLLSRSLLIMARDARELGGCDGKEFKDISLGADIYSA